MQKNHRKEVIGGLIVISVIGILAFTYIPSLTVYTPSSVVAALLKSGDSVLGFKVAIISSLKVGLITADEVEFAGGKNADNKQYYLYNGQNYWTMSPNYWSSGYAGENNHFIDYIPRKFYSFVHQLIV